MRDMKPKKDVGKMHVDATKGGQRRAAQMEIEQSLMVKCATNRDAETITRFLTWQSEHPGEGLSDYIAELGAQRARAERAGIIAMKQMPEYRREMAQIRAQESSMSTNAFRGMDRARGRSADG